MHVAGLPLLPLVGILIGLPVAVALFLGWAAMRGEPRQLYRCRRCGGGFQRKAHRAFPDACPRCHARDWNA